MLEPQERRLLHEVLKPPAGYVLDQAIATTFSLDLLTLLGIPLAFTSFQVEDESGRLDPSPFALLEAARRHAEQVSIYCQAGRIVAPARQQPLLSFLETSVTEVTSPNDGGVFHPKVWALRYSGGGPAWYRVACLSRNLTNSKAWDVSAVVEGELKERKQGYTRNRPLGDFLAALPGLAIRTPVASKTVERARLMADEIRRVDFAVPDGFEELAFHPLGLPGYNGFPLRAAGKHRLVISPFVTSRMLERISDTEGETILVSRSEELDTIHPECLNRFKEVLVLREEMAVNQTTVEDESDETIEDETLSGLHAKVYVADDGAKSTAWIGSPNATQAAFSRNVEFMLSFVGPRRFMGVDAVVQGGTEDDVGLRVLLMPYAPPESYEPNAAQEQLEKRVDVARLALAQEPLAAIVTTSADGAMRLALRRTEKTAANIESDAIVHVRPITLTESGAVAYSRGDEIAADFGTVTKAALTTFFALRVEIRAEGRTASCSFVINVPLEGAPEGRRAELIRDLLSDADSVQRFLMLMLSGDLRIGSVDDVVTTATNTSATTTSIAKVQFLELLLEHLHHAPTRLDEMAETIEALTAAETGNSKLPPGFLSVWEPIRKAREQLRATESK